jgi:hypothetical protein
VKFARWRRRSGAIGTVRRLGPQLRQTAGYIAFVENLSGKGGEQPVLATQTLKARGKMLRVMAGPNGSIRGRVRRKGFPTQTVCDWTATDGWISWRIDLGRCTGIAISARAEHGLAAAQPVEVEWGRLPAGLGLGWMRPEARPCSRSAFSAGHVMDRDAVDVRTLTRSYLAFFGGLCATAASPAASAACFLNEKGERSVYSGRAGRSFAASSVSRIGTVTGGWTSDQLQKR